MLSDTCDVDMTTRQRMRDQPTDLSFYNWTTKQPIANDSPNFKTDASNGSQGLLFRNKRDRKVINVDPSYKNEDNTTRHENITSNKYEQIVIYEHVTRKKH